LATTESITVTKPNHCGIVDIVKGKCVNTGLSSIDVTGKLVDVTCTSINLDSIVNGLLETTHGKVWTGDIAGGTYHLLSSITVCKILFVIEIESSILKCSRMETIICLNLGWVEITTCTTVVPGKLVLRWECL
jgi:hypothetical protein